MSKTIYTLRHSATDAAKRNIILGQMDEDINEEGHELIGQFLKCNGRISCDQLISSPLKRALSTAIGVSGVKRDEIVTSFLCIERNYGKLQGVEPDLLPGVSPETFYVEVGGIRHSLNPPGGETLEEVRKRAVVFLDYLFALPGTLMVVSHQCFLTQLHGSIRNQDVYHAMAGDIGMLEWNRFEFKGQKLVDEELLFKLDSEAYHSW